MISGSSFHYSCLHLLLCKIQRQYRDHNRRYHHREGKIGKVVREFFRVIPPRTAGKSFSRMDQKSLCGFEMDLGLVYSIGKKLMSLWHSDIGIGNLFQFINC